jgi:transcriptional regulator with XRE-family HTH domain
MRKNQALLDQFGAMVKALREERGLTQQELAERSGMTEKHVGEIERGASEASVTAIAALAKGLHVTVNDLLPETLHSYVEPAQWRKLHALRERTGTPVGEMVRRAIDEYLAHHLSPREIQMIRTEISKEAKKQRSPDRFARKAARLRARTRKRSATDQQS